jgi:hypothetical protein
MKKDIQKVSIHLKRKNLQSLKEKELPLSFLMDYLLENLLNNIKRNQEVENELRKNLQEFIQKS